MLPLSPVMSRSALSLLCALFLASCASSPVLRSLKDVRDSYRPGDWVYVDSLLDALAQPNRDIQAASIERLLRYHEALGELDPSSWPLDPSLEKALADPDRRRERAKILAAKKEAIHAKQELIRRQFERQFALAPDFNVRNLCLWARSRCGDSNVPLFLAKAIQDNDPACSDYALMLLRPYLSPDFALAASFDIFARCDFPVFSTVLGNLLLYPPTEAIRQALANYQGLTKDSVKRRLLEDALASYKIPPPSSAAPSNAEPDSPRGTNLIRLLPADGTPRK